MKGKLDITGRPVYVPQERALEEISFKLSFDPVEWQRLRSQWEAGTFMRFMLTELELMPRYDDKPEVMIRLQRVAD